MYLCWYKYKLGDGDPKADYWSMGIESNWRVTSGPSSWNAITTQRINSSNGSIDNIYGSSPTMVSTTDCWQTFTLHYRAGPFGASTTPKWCKDYKVNRDTSSGSQASWSATKAGKLRSVETSFTQKVPQGTVPRYTASFGIPQYKSTLMYNSYWVSTSNLAYHTYSV